MSGPESHIPAPSTVAFDVGEVLIDETRLWTLWAELIGVSPTTLAAVLGAAVVQGEHADAVFAHLVPNVEWRGLEGEHERLYGGFEDRDLYPDVRPCFDELTAAGFRIVVAGNQPARRRALRKRWRA
ncbi:MAG: HAD family hydrolase [Nitriliruptoraceae bacterium]